MVVTSTFQSFSLSNQRYLYFNRRYNSKWKYLLKLKLQCGRHLICCGNWTIAINVNVSNRTRSTRLQSCELSTLGAIFFAYVKSDLLIHANTEGTVSISMFQRNQITQYFNQSGVLILVDLIYDEVPICIHNIMNQNMQVVQSHYKFNYLRINTVRSSDNVLNNLKTIKNII